MTRFDRITLGRQAKELGFVRDTFEKVCRLADVLSFMESDGLLIPVIWCRERQKLWTTSRYRQTGTT